MDSRDTFRASPQRKQGKPPSDVKLPLTVFSGHLGFGSISRDTQALRSGARGLHPLSRQSPNRGEAHSLRYEDSASRLIPFSTPWMSTRWQSVNAHGDRPWAFRVS